MSKMCIRCGKEVLPTNNAVRLDIIIGTDFSYPLESSLHLLPVVVDGETICIGSPSRAQYLKNGPRDTRSKSHYNSQKEEPVRKAYAQMQRDVHISQYTSKDAFHPRGKCCGGVSIYGIFARYNKNLNLEYTYQVILYDILQSCVTITIIIILTLQQL